MVYFIQKYFCFNELVFFMQIIFSLCIFIIFLVNIEYLYILRSEFSFRENFYVIKEGLRKFSQKYFN